MLLRSLGELSPSRPFAFLVFALCVVLNSGFGVGQNPPRLSIPYGFADKPKDCEINLIRMEWVRNLANEETAYGSKVIVIARLGDGEKLQALNRRRLENVLTVLTDNLGLDKRRVVLATAERVSGYGGVEIYVGGKLVDKVLANRSKDLCVDCCDIDERYYPFRKSKRL